MDADTIEDRGLHPCSRCGEPWPWPDDLCSRCFYQGADE